MMRKIIVRLLLVVALGAVTAAAQEMPRQAMPAPQGMPGAEPTPRATAGPDLGRWWKNSEIARELGLTDAQVADIEKRFLDHRIKLIDLRAELEKQETLLQPLMDADQPDEAKVSAQIDRVLAARGQLEKANAMMMLSIRRVLSVEQWKKLQAIQESRGMRMPPPPRPNAPASAIPARPPDEPNF